MASPPTLPTAHANPQNILAADINDIAAGINKTYLGITRYNLESWGGLRNTDNATVLSSIMTAMSSAPGILYVPGGAWPYSNSGGLIIPKTACGIIGEGWSSILQPTANVNAHALSTHISSNGTTDPNASGATFMNFQLDCSNMLGSGGFGPGAPIANNGINVTSLPAFGQNSGDQRVQSIGFTTALSGTGSVQSYTVKNSGFLSVGDTVTIVGAVPAGYNGTYTVATSPSSTLFTVAGAATGAQTTAGYVINPNGGLGVDGSIRHLIQNILVRNAPQDNFAASGQGEMMWFRNHSYNSGRYGFIPTFDSILEGCTAAQSGTHGFHFGTNPIRAIGCKAYYSGKVTPASGMGYFVNGGSSGGIEIIGCEAQDNRAHGFQVTNSENVNLIGCIADSNSGTFANTVGASGGLDIFQTTNSNFEVSCMDRQDGGAGFNRQLWAVQVRSTSINNRIRVTHLATVGSVNAPVNAWDANCVGNDVSINGSQGQQNLAYAASITPDPTRGGEIIVGALTGAITINAVAAGNQWPGQHISFHLTQDATGGRTMTWNAQYHLSASATALSTAASKRNVVDFTWDATASAYIEVSRSPAV